MIDLMDASYLSFSNVFVFIFCRCCCCFINLTAVARLGSDAIQFVGVLIQEAHATDVWPVGLDDAVAARCG